MSAFMLTQTTTALLRDLHDRANDSVWAEFDRRYRPVLIAMSRRLGLSTDDASDAAQETLTQFVTAYRAGRYDPDKGRLHSWIIGIARNCIARIHDQRRRQKIRRGMSAIETLPDDQALTNLWNSECRTAILQRAMELLPEQTRLTEQTLRIFSELTQRDRSADELAAELGVSREDVYVAKHRCLKHLRGIVDSLQQAYELDP